MSTDTTAVPAGYWKDANGALIPVAKIKDIDKDRHRTVTELCEQAKKESARLAGFKFAAMSAVSEFVQRSLDAYDVKHGGKKGNVTLVSFDGRYKIVRQIQESLTFDERLQAAKALIDECLKEWSKGSNANIKALVNSAFQVDSAGLISTTRVLRLRSVNIDEPKWLRAMEAISDSIQVASTKPYIRFYERLGEGDSYTAISLDVATL